MLSANLMTEKCPLIKFADEMAMAKMMRVNSEVRLTILLNYLELNVSKTKEMIVDFRRPSRSLPPILIKDVEVERVSTYKYLCSVLDEKLAWTAHVDSIIKRPNSRMFCLRKLVRFVVRT